MVFCRCFLNVLNIIIHYIIGCYNFAVKIARQKGKILCTMVSCIYRQNSKVLKIIYIKTWIEVMKDMVNSRYRDRVTDGQRQGRSGEYMMNSRYKEIVTCEQETW